ncbi:MAG: hypothetical protein DLM59_11200 [Pseudonocardiales bacterium]|nr:MAG: hypothetical protein DLM59_11200 [Pseudonocardiales bacterium]
MTAAEPSPEVDALYALSDILLRRYLLRDLLWCAPCDRPKVPLLLGRLSRYYACRGGGCPHPALPAKITEHRVWNRFVRQDGTVPPGLPPADRHERLRHELRRVVVGPEMTQLWLEWWQ